MTPYSKWSSACENDHELSHDAAQPLQYTLHTGDIHCKRPFKSNVQQEAQRQ